jgi:tripartite-type tricarboxylate transporter receptor subunit TctC
MQVRGLARAILSAAVCWCVWTALAHAQSPAEFYKGKTVELYIGYSVGGGYDLYARLLARHLGKHIPGNPTIVPKNMEGAASLRLANWLAKAAPRDGTAIGTVGRGIPFDPLLGFPGAQFKGTDFSWIGSANNEVSICVSWDASKITKIQDLLTKEMVIGGTGASDDTVQFPRILNAVLGTKFKIVSGYPGGNDVILAMERGEVEGRCGWSWSTVLATHADWVKQKKIHVLVQLALNKHPDLPDVPLITELAQSKEQEQMLKLVFARQSVGRPYFAPPGIPKDRLAALRQAFMDTMTDKDFLADAERSKLEIVPVDGDQVEQLVHEVYETPETVVKKAAAILTN